MTVKRLGVMGVAACVTAALTFSLGAPVVIATTPEPDCAIQDVQCWKNFYGIKTPDYGWNTPTPVVTPTPTPPVNKVIDEENETVTEPDVQIEDNTLMTETAEELLDEEYFGGETVIVQKTDGEIIVGSVTPQEKTDLEGLADVSVIENDAPVYINYQSHWGTDRINQPDLPLDE